MLRRSVPILSGGVKEYHEWHLREPLLNNYEGWRILDDPTYSNNLEFLKDLGGQVRHTDPIIDDPRLTHQQRVCRLYRWALKDFAGGIVGGYHELKCPIGFKVIRQRFEKYRYVTDPTMCDMMVRETQKYLREFACAIQHHLLRRNATSPGSNAYQQNVLFHPDHSQCYDHWTSPEVFWYDDAKLHRYSGHHPLYSGPGEQHDRFGLMDDIPGGYRVVFTTVTGLCVFFCDLALACAACDVHGDQSRRMGPLRGVQRLRSFRRVLLRRALAARTFRESAHQP